MAAPRSVATDVEGIEAITNGLTQTILGNNVVNTNLAVAATPARTDDIDEITNGLGQAILGEDENQRLATHPAGEKKAAEKEDQGAKLHGALSAENKIAEKSKASHKKEGEDAIDALGAACSSWSLETEEEAEARCEAQRLREQIQKKHEDNMKALEKAEEKRRADEQCDALERQLKAQVDGARLHKMKRKARKEKDQEAARELRIAAEAEAIVIAERRARQERRAHDEAIELQAKREADNRARLELTEAYERIFYNTTIAKANARQAELQKQQREAELIVRYHEVVARQAQLVELQQWQQEELFLQQHQAQLAELERQQQEELLFQQHQAQLAELERQQQEELLFQQHHAHPPNGQVSESVEEMDTALEAEACEFTEMDTAPEMEASRGTEMEWEIEDEKSRLPAELVAPSSPTAPESSAPAQGLPSPDELLTAVKKPGNKVKAENFSTNSSSQSAAMASTVATATPEPPARAPLHLPPLRETSKARRIDKRSQAPAASPAPPQVAAQAATPQPSRAPAPPLAAVLPVESPAALAAPASPPPPPRVPASSLVPPSPPPPPLPPPPPARPASSIPALTIVFQKRAVRNSTLVTIRPTVNAWSPLGRLLRQHKTIPRVTLTQVLGKRAREDGVEGERDKKTQKFEGEFQLQVGGKRKREDEELPGKKRAFLSRGLAVPCSRFAASRSADNAVPKRTLAPTSTPRNHPPNHPPTPAPSTPPAPLLYVLESLPVNPPGGLAEAIEFYNDLPKLRREIAWMRAQRQIAATSKKTSIGKKATEHTMAQASWAKYRENLSR